MSNTAPVRVESSLATSEPLINHDSREYWAATLRGELLLSVCPSCERVIWYPKPVCAACGGVSTEQRPASGRGQIYSYTIVRKGLGEYAESGPYVVAIVELEEGPRIITNVVDADLDDLRIGADVDLVFDVAGDEAALPRFLLKR